MLITQMKATLPLVCLFVCQTIVHAQQTNSFPLWSQPAPGALGTAAKDTPTLTVYLPEKTNRAMPAMVICPGGGYGHLADHEGSHYARWLNSMGIAGFVLKYRLGTAGYHHPAMLQDATRAIRTVRARAAEWNVDPARVGIMGSSAGGHLTSTMITHFSKGTPAAVDPVDRESSRPDLAILCYPVVTMIGPFAHAGSKSNLIGPSPTEEVAKELSAELNIRSNTPPCFIWHTYEDKTVPVENSLQLAAALRAAGVPFDLHIYEKGAHGLGLGTRSGYDPARFLPWIRDCEHWLKQRGFIDQK
jgi:acetyl esterase/lipase